MTTLDAIEIMAQVKRMKYGRALPFWLPEILRGKGLGEIKQSLSRMEWGSTYPYTDGSGFDFKTEIKGFYAPIEERFPKATGRIKIGAWENAACGGGNLLWANQDAITARVLDIFQKFSAVDVSAEMTYILENLVGIPSYEEKDGYSSVDYLIFAREDAPIVAPYTMSHAGQCLFRIGDGDTWDDARGGEFMRVMQMPEFTQEFRQILRDIRFSSDERSWFVVVGEMESFVQFYFHSYILPRPMDDVLEAFFNEFCTKTGHAHLSWDGKEVVYPDRAEFFWV